MDLAAAIARLVAREDLTSDEMSQVVGALMDGQATPAQVGGLLVALRMKGETVDEVVGAALAMRARALKLRVPAGVVVDTCGTGGDGRGTINISTMAALVVAAAGVRVAKHGNRASSSRAGSADLLEALGVRVDVPVATVERCLEELHIGFLFAPAFHGATRHVMPARREIAIRTVFNLLGPLTNPAGARHQLLGVYDGRLVEPMARALGRLGSTRALVVHGAGNLDELAPAGESQVAELDGGEVSCYRLTPHDFGLAEEDEAGLAGGDARDNAEAARAIFGGTRGAGRSCVVMSAAAALYAADDAAPRGRPGDAGSRARSAALGEQARRAERLLDDGSVSRLLGRLVDMTRGGRMILDGIVAARRQAIAARDATELHDLRLQARDLPPTRAFRGALTDARRPTPRVIAEFKRRSPSAGAIRPGADPAEIAASYAFHGAAALSILTNAEFFDGDLGHLQRASSAAPLPILRKDFLLDERDLVESRLAGADAVLLIARILAPGELRTLLSAARALELGVLVETHTEEEMHAARAAGADVIGVNHRDLDTLEIDLSLSARARELVGSDVVLVAESGIRTRQDLDLMRAHGVDAVLIGEALMREPSPGRALAALLAPSDPGPSDAGEPG